MPKKRRKKGSNQAMIGRRKKKYWMKAEDGPSLSHDLDQDDASEQDIIETWTDSVQSISDSETDLDISATAGPATSCCLSVSESHVCFDSDNIVETPSELETGTDDTESEEASSFLHPPPMRSKTRMSEVGFRRKRSTRNTQSEYVDTSGQKGRTENEKSVDESSSRKKALSPNLERDAQQFSSRLVSHLTPLLPSEWSSSVVKGYIVRAIKLNDSENAGVISTVLWNWAEGSWSVFVHGKPLPRDNTLLKSIPLPEAGNISIIADFLIRVMKKVDGSIRCSGVIDFQEFWRISSAGFVDDSDGQSSPCFRSLTCALLVSGKKPKPICSKCHFELLKFEKEQERRQQSSRKPTHVADKYCTMEEMKAKKDYYKNQYKKQKLRADRMENKIGTLQVKLDDVLRDELTGVLVSNEHKMTDLQKTFWESQRLALAANDKRGVRWHPMLIRIALHIHSKSPSTYEYLQETGILQLPSSRRLYDYTHFIDTNEGCQGEIITYVKRKVDACGLEKHFSFINLMFDEMHIRAGLVTKRSTGELIGFTSLDDTEKELMELQSELINKIYKPRLAKKVLVYLVQGITCESVKDVVAVYSTDDMCAVQLYNRTWEVIYHLEKAGIGVLSVTCDGAATNRKFIRMHYSLDKSCKVVYSTKNLYSGDFRPLFFFVDPPHLLKTVRNCIANSFRHRKTRELWKNGEHLSWEVFEQLFLLTKNDKFRTHKLTQAHVKLNNFSCMTVLFATQTLSKSVADSIEDIGSHESMQSLDTSELVKLIRFMNRFFDCLNGKEKDGQSELEHLNENLDLAAYLSSADERLDFLENEFLKFFEDWKFDVMKREGKFSSSERNAMVLSHQSLEALVITVKSFKKAISYMLDEANAPKVNARAFNQDPLEQYFGKIRRSLGDNRQPFLQAVLDKRLDIHAQGSAALPPKKGNITLQSRGLKVDSSPLPVRKKKR